MFREACNAAMELYMTNALGYYFIMASGAASGILIYEGVPAVIEIINDVLIKYGVRKPKAK